MYTKGLQNNTQENFNYKEPEATYISTHSCLTQKSLASDEVSEVGHNKLWRMK